jgi:hypothetical protein
MLILFDQGTPVPIRRFLKNHTIRTAAQEGWDRISNGELIIRAESARFDLLLTTDKNIEYQQNLKGRKIAIIVIGNPQWPMLRQYVQLVVEAVDGAQPGSYLLVEIPDR